MKKASDILVEIMLVFYIFLLVPLPYLQYECTVLLRTETQTCEYTLILSNGIQTVQNLVRGYTPELIFIIGNVIAFMISFLIADTIISFSNKKRKKKVKRR